MSSRVVCTNNYCIKHKAKGNKSDSKIITTDEKGKIIIWDKELNQIQELKY